MSAVTQTTAFKLCSTMAEVRSQVDALDDVLVPLLVQRSRYMLQAAHIKQHVSQVRDEGRIEAIVQRIRQRALGEGGAPDVLESMYRSIMEVCIAYEHEEFGRLKASDDARTPALAEVSP
jgi:isochorismate pyruvate lyase